MRQDRAAPSPFKIFIFIDNFGLQTSTQGMQHRICVAQFICGKMQTGPINTPELQTVSWQSRQKTSTDDGLKKII
jgi:hypothetical protein